MSESNGTLLRKEQVDERNAKILRGWMHRWARNAARNWAEGLITDDNNLRSLEMKHKGVPALVTGSGPSLADSLQIVNGDFPGITITTNSGVSACMRYGLKPDYVHVFDGELKPERFDGVPVDGCSLISVSTAQPDLYKFWKDKGDVYAFHMYDPGHHFFTEMQWYYWTFDALPTSGSVGPNAVRLAAYMGCDPIIIVGLDLGFSGGRYRVDQFQLDNGQWITKPFDHEGMINRQVISYEKGHPCWRITGMLYKTAMCQIVKQIREEGVAFVRIKRADQNTDSWQLSNVFLNETKGTKVYNATLSGIWDGEIPTLDLADWLGRKAA